MKRFLTNNFNIEIIKFIQGFSSPFLDKLFQFVTMIGEEAFFIVIISILCWCINKKIAYRIGFTIVSSMSINGVIKESLKIPRVFNENGIRALRIKTATGYSFPSGHTQGTASFWISAMINNKKKWTYVLGTTIIILVGMSRLYLGVHRPVDIVGAIIISVIWVSIANKIFDLLEEGNILILILFILLMFFGLFLFKGHDYYVSVGTVVGFSIGYIVEKKCIDFCEKASFLENIFKVIFGLAMTLAIKIVLKNIFPEHLISDFIRYTFLGVWITAGAPYLFKKMKIA